MDSMYDRLNKLQNLIKFMAYINLYLLIFIFKDVIGLLLTEKHYY